MISLEDENTVAKLKEENAVLRTALEEAFQGIRWYVTVLGLAVLTHGDGFIINNNLIHQLESKFTDKELNFDTEELEEEGFVKIKIRWENTENDTVSAKKESK